jgi:hypothetical protein
LPLIIEAVRSAQPLDHMSRVADLRQTHSGPILIAA